MNETYRLGKLTRAVMIENTLNQACGLNVRARIGRFCGAMIVTYFGPREVKGTKRTLASTFWGS